MVRFRRIARGLVRVLLFVALGLGAGGAVFAQAEGHEPPPQANADSDWSLDFDLTYNSKYVWRGIQVTPDPVLQPSVNVAYKDLTLNVWANVDTTDVGDVADKFNEIDFTLDYSFSVKCLSVSVGAIYYVFPQAHAADTTEAYLAIGVDVLTSPTLTVYQDLDEQDGQYMTLSFGHTFEDVWKPNDAISMSVDLGASFAWGSRKHNEFYYGAGAGWADATVSLGVPFAIGDHVTVTPSVNYMWILDGDITGALGDDDALWAGISVTVSF
jgi:hypothetical protein